MSLYFSENVKNLLRGEKQVVVWDDCKGKSQSFEAYYVDEDVNVIAEGFGSNVDEAMFSLKCAIQKKLEEEKAILENGISLIQLEKYRRV